MVEQSAVNRLVTGSSPVAGAQAPYSKECGAFFVWGLVGYGLEGAGVGSRGYVHLDSALGVAFSNFVLIQVVMQAG